MTNVADSIDLAARRALLRAAFTAAELRRFCHDRPTFRPIVDRFGPASGLDDMVDEVITYCEKHLHFDELLAGIQQENPEQYERFSTNIRPPAAHNAGLRSKVSGKQVKVGELKLLGCTLRNLAILLSLTLVMSAALYGIAGAPGIWPRPTAIAFTTTTPRPATLTPTLRPTGTPKPPLTGTSLPTSTLLPIDTPLPTSTLSPTDTPSPTPTNVPLPTDTPSPAPTHTPVRPTRTPVPMRTPTPVPCEGDTTGDLTTQLFQAYDQQNYAKALACSFQLERRWSVEAKQQQGEKQASDCGYTPNPADQAAVDNFWAKYWALNDVATGLFMRAEIFRIQDKCQESKTIYKQVIDEYPCAFAWNPSDGGFFWSVAKGAQGGLSSPCP